MSGDSVASATCGSVLRGLVASALLAFPIHAAPRASDGTGGIAAGVARVDITPSTPIRLCGYASRDAEAERAAQALFARALAVGEGAGLAVLVSVDLIGIPAWITDEVAARLARQRGLARERFTLAATHTHTGPCLAGAIDLMFGRPIPAEHAERIERYTAVLVDRIEQAALAAIDARAPATLEYGEGRAGFARNRRTAGGPTDPAVPVLAVRGPDGALRAVVSSYACHCTTCGPGINEHCGDWAGYASETVEAAHAGAVALTLIGCGADANPAPGVTGRIEDARDHGRTLAREIERVLAAPMRPLLAEGGAPECRLARLELPYDTLPTREEFAERARREDAIGNHARHWLARLERGEPLPVSLPYSVQTWVWGEELAQVFLPGEVVVDYSLRLKRELDRARLWVSAYSNDLPCYIPSRRVLAEGGYEAEGAMTYYGRPGRLAPSIEDRIVGAVKELIPDSFDSGEQERRFPPPKSPQESQACFELSRDDLRIERVASEPAVRSPVAIDFGPDGTVWVCEMFDYPSGARGRYEPGGRITWLRDRDRDGTFESSGVFLEELPFPTGVMAWRDGVLVCAAPDIVFAEDRDGDGRADSREVLFTGFSTENYQARVNSLTWGLDGWVYGACGLFGGVITPMGPDGAGAPVDCRGRDFRIDPDRRVIEPVEGTSQQGRVRDDFGAWFGCDSGCLVFQFPMADRFVRRNPSVPALDPRWNLIADADPGRLFQVSPRLERFNDLGDASRVTSACGVGIYRDVLLGEDLFGDAFSCEPVANVVRRIELSRARDEVVLRGRRAPEEQEREFLASRDPWFRPVQATTGPDGALWVVDMCRFVIEHPRWIPAATLAELDVRAGAQLGRIWRVVPVEAPLREVPDVGRLDERGLRAAMVTHNGVVRDLVQRESLRRPRPEPKHRTLEELVRDLEERRGRRSLTRSAPDAAIRVQQAWLEELREGPSEHALELLDPEWPVEARAQGIELCARGFEAHPRLAGFVARAGLGEMPRVPIFERYEPPKLLSFHAALVLGDLDGEGAGDALGALLANHLDDAWIRAAVLSSATPHVARVLESVLALPDDAPGRTEAIEQLVATAAGLAADGVAPERDPRLRVLATLLGVGEGTEPGTASRAAREPWRWRALARLLPGLASHRELVPTPWWDGPGSGALTGPLTDRLRELAAEARAALAQRPPDSGPALAALELLFVERDAAQIEADREDWSAPLQAAAALLEPAFPIELQLGALAAMGRNGAPAAPRLVLASLSVATPRAKAAALELLLSRRAWTGELLDALASGRAPARALDAAARARLLGHADPATRERAAALLAPAGTPRRAAVLAQLAPALELEGAPARGRETFARLCASCHLFRGVGHDVAPTLSALSDRSPPALLAAILDPNAAVDAEFVAYEVTLATGEELSGLVRAESGSGFTIVQANDLRRAVLRRDVTSIRPTRLSLMPDGLEEGLEPQDLADLIAWLRSAPAPLGAIPAEQAAAAREALLAETFGGFERVVAAWDVFDQPTWFGRCTMHYCRQTDGASKVSWRTRPIPAAGAGDPANVELRFPAALGFLSQPDGWFTLAVDGTRRLEFDVAVDDATWRSDDGRVTLSFECRAAHREDATGVMTLALPRDLVREGEPCTLEVTGSAAGSQRWFGVLVPEE